MNVNPAATLEQIVMMEEVARRLEARAKNLFAEAAQLRAELEEVEQPFTTPLNAEERARTPHMPASPKDTLRA